MDNCESHFYIGIEPDSNHAFEDCDEFVTVCASTEDKVKEQLANNVASYASYNISPEEVQKWVKDCIIVKVKCKPLEKE